MLKNVANNLCYAALTDIGRRREHNEDNYRVNVQQGLFVVADGMGGHASGEVASEIAVATVESCVLRGDSLVHAVEQAHLAVIDGVRQGLGKRGMGTTVVALILRGCDYTLAWVGDSRAYLCGESIRQISKDHSLVQMLIDSGQISEAEARVHPRKNIIYQNLGAEDLEHFQVASAQGCLYRNQKLLLCSDGLSDELDDQTIDDIVKANDTEQSIAENLIAAANEKGGHDNITVIVVSAPETASEMPEVTRNDTVKDRDTLVPE